MKAMLASAVALAVVAGVLPAAARHHHGGGARVEMPRHAEGGVRGGLPAGLYTVKLLAPTLAPAMTLDEQVFKICYSAADAEAHRNPVMPAPERAACKQEMMTIGDDLAFDDYCADGQHRLRISRINEASYGGTYRFLAKAKGGPLLEPAVQMRREGDCP